MQGNFDFFVVYTEVSIAFVAFATIVATLRQAFGGGLTPLKYLLFRFFVEIGFIYVIVAIAPIALVNILTSELQVWRILTYMILVTIALGLPFYIYRRIKTKAPIPLISRLVMIGYGISLILMITTATELFWLPSLATTSYMLIWGLVSNIAIFLYFLGTFIEHYDIDAED